MSQSKEWTEKQTIYKTENDAEDFQCEEFSLGLMGPNGGGGLGNGKLY